MFGSLSFADKMTFIAGLLLLILAVYAAVRVGSFAYFRTKTEYLRSVLKVLKGGGDRNG